MLCNSSGYHCGRDLPEEMFKKIKGSGLSNKCLDCRRKQNEAGTPGYRKNYAMNQKYGVGLDVLQQMTLLQEGKCAICQETPEPPRYLNLDHCHTTGKVRELLCWKCNIAIGHLRDNADYAQSLVAYLRRHQD